MTGFGRAAGPVGEGSAEILARSVNHRSLDLTIKVREADLSLEPLVRGVFSRKTFPGQGRGLAAFEAGGRGRLPGEPQ